MSQLSLHKMSDLDLTGKRVLIRCDLNVPIENGEITSDARLRASLPTITQALATAKQVIVMSHLGRPTEGKIEAKFSLQPIADYLSQALNQAVTLHNDLQQAPTNSLVLLENVRFNAGEKKNDEQLAKAYASLCDIFVMDAFGTAHRAQASTEGVARFADTACAGPLLVNELDALSKALLQPEQPVVAIVGGSKVSTKLTVLETLSKKVDGLIVGGGIANTFLAASGTEVGKSLYEPDLIEQAKTLMANTHIPLPVDVVVAGGFDDTDNATTKVVSDIQPEDAIFDIGPQTADQLADILTNAKTILWNGPVGVFEKDAFAEGTAALTRAIAQSSAFSLAGGGDTLAAIDKFHATDDISYISTGGGAFLEFVEGKTLPAVAILESRYRTN